MFLFLFQIEFKNLNYLLFLDLWAGVASEWNILYYYHECWIYFMSHTVVNKSTLLLLMAHSLVDRHATVSRFSANIKFLAVLLLFSYLGP